jgi:hypothetical protein
MRLLILNAYIDSSGLSLFCSLNDKYRHYFVFNKDLKEIIGEFLTTQIVLPRRDLIKCFRSLCTLQSSCLARIVRLYASNNRRPNEPRCMKFDTEDFKWNLSLKSIWLTPHTSHWLLREDQHALLQYPQADAAHNSKYLSEVITLNIFWTETRIVNNMLDAIFSESKGFRHN